MRFLLGFVIGIVLAAVAVNEIHYQWSAKEKGQTPKSIFYRLGLEK